MNNTELHFTRISWDKIIITIICTAVQTMCHVSNNFQLLIERTYQPVYYLNQSVVLEGLLLGNLAYFDVNMLDVWKLLASSFYLWSDNRNLTLDT